MAKVEYLVSIGLAVLLEMYKSEADERKKNPQPADVCDDALRHVSVESAIKRINEMKLPKSEVARLLNRSF